MKTTELMVVKIGGSILDDEPILANFIEEFSRMDALKILVHGGGKQADRLLERLGIESKMHQGRRITDNATLEAVVMTYAGKLNKQIVVKLQSAGCNALGFTGADADVIRSEKRTNVSIDYGWAGDIVHVDTALPEYLLENRIVPVFCALTHDGNGQLLNTNADTIASSLAVAFSSRYITHLCYGFEKPGVLQDVNDENSLISQINTTSYYQLLNDGIIADGMKPKLKNSFDALNKGVASVRIGRPLELIHRTDHYSLLQL